MRFLKKLNPLPGIKDFWTEFRRPNPHRVPVLLVSILITGTMFYTLLPESEIRLPPPPEIIYITSFAPNRSDAEIMKSNIEAEKKKERRAAMEAMLIEKRKEFGRALGKATGVDTDALERRYAEMDEAKAKASQVADKTKTEAQK